MIRQAARVACGEGIVSMVTSGSCAEGGLPTGLADRTGTVLDGRGVHGDAGVAVLGVVVVRNTPQKAFAS